ncbi:2OG-Fe(II) oxygenase [Nocardia sp. SC052]|uniref:2OG-Fe(II) oxygenase n=1 Tax=Nocardia sichangensis TaxID=3385975 RepID=UPI0039A1961E
MIRTDIELSRYDSPFVHYSGDGLLSREDLAVLNAELPDRSVFSREIKSGEQWRKEYRMWRCEPANEGARTAVADRLPRPWSDLVNSVLSRPFREWLSEQTQVALQSCPLSVGLYIFEDGDFTTIDTGKLEKALTFGLYLNETWLPEFGGEFQAFDRKSPDVAPVRETVPVGGRCITFTPTESSWHRIAGVDTGGRFERLLMMLEFWRK